MGNFEKIPKEHICDGLASGMMLKGNQHGFIRGRSCQTNLIAFYDQVTKAMDAGVAMDVVLLDFSKAFVYEIYEGLRDLNLFSLHKRRLRGDLVTVCKLTRGDQKGLGETLFPQRPLA